MFITIDKPLKAWGDKHLVLDVAELVIGCARRVPSRGRAEVEGEAQAMICGKSWALQRIGRLDEARIAAEKSLELGEDIGWDRNTAYCEKCIGRLYRIMAEEASDPGRETGTSGFEQNPTGNCNRAFLPLPGVRAQPPRNW